MIEGMLAKEKGGADLSAHAPSTEGNYRKTRKTELLFPVDNRDDVAGIFQQLLVLSDLQIF